MRTKKKKKWKLKKIDGDDDDDDDDDNDDYADDDDNNQWVIFLQCPAQASNNTTYIGKKTDLDIDLDIGQKLSN